MVSSVKTVAVPNNFPDYYVQVCHSKALVNLRAVTIGGVGRKRQEKTDRLPCFWPNHAAKRMRSATLPDVVQIIIVHLWLLVATWRGYRAGSSSSHHSVRPTTSERLLFFEPALVYFTFIPAVNKQWWDEILAAGTIIAREKLFKTLIFKQAAILSNNCKRALFIQQFQWSQDGRFRCCHF